MDDFQQQKFNDIKFEKPLFYNSSIGLRFEIGPTDIDVWANYDKYQLNETYFNLALDRAINIFETVFEKNDNISIVYQIFSDGRRKIKKGSFIFKQIKELNTRNITFSDHRDIYSEDLNFKCECWRRVTISGIKVHDVNYKNILNSLVNADFGIRQPSMKGECFFINHDKRIVLNLYDDRGMDVIAIQKQALENLYQKHNEWILGYDKEQIDKMFS
jgi:hypothetical protein